MSVESVTNSTQGVSKCWEIPYGDHKVREWTDYSKGVFEKKCEDFIICDNMLAIVPLDVANGSNLGISIATRFFDRNERLCPMPPRAFPQTRSDQDARPQ